ncbi:tungsten cofactor oxidoreductase radical SAM maturase [Marinitoga aeolica]|uniref:Tungsten cofactor oxidoreductase radical SAM maturase n=1 Tax=Marinitoga aeolica TaxID=2809031 RepID=A0ABY8PNZ0_9BACT|nr:tungsten cofactor oxidoreductase radical SAM maturase [Marinitoga aeolica]WGS64301.1 tungsten cofactor oxidoreductase radical SAM maturase [Marinitoga aeolica]
MKEYIFKMNAGELILKPQKDLKKLYIELSSRCNLDCPMCFKNTFTDPEGFMSKGTFDKIIKDLKEFPEVDHIIFGGIGECTMNPHFLDMVRKVKNEGYMITITSNGYMLSDLLIMQLIDLKVDELVVSVETGDVGHPSFKYVEKLLEKFSKYKEQRNTGKPALSIETVLTKKNYMDFGNIVKSLLPYGIRKVVISNLLPVYEHFLGLELYSEDSKEKDVELRKLISNAVTAKVSAVIPNFKLKTERHCNFIEKNATVIRWDGEVVPCYRFLHDGIEYVYGQKKEIKAYSFGNIEKNTLSEIWTSKDYTWFRYKVKNSLFPSCTDCDLKDGCQFVETTQQDCWGNEPSCADCLWWRNIIMCP